MSDPEKALDSVFTAKQCQMDRALGIRNITNDYESVVPRVALDLAPQPVVDAMVRQSFFASAAAFVAIIEHSMKPKQPAKPAPLSPAQRREQDRKEFKERMDAENRSRKR